MTLLRVKNAGLHPVTITLSILTMFTIKQLMGTVIHIYYHRTVDNEAVLEVPKHFWDSKKIIYGEQSKPILRKKIKFL